MCSNTFRSDAFKPHNVNVLRVKLVVAMLALVAGVVTSVYFFINETYRAGAVLSPPPPPPPPPPRAPCVDSSLNVGVTRFDLDSGLSFVTHIGPDGSLVVRGAAARAAFAHA